MPYISLDNLTQYNGRLRDYIDGSFDKLDGANWRKTSAAQSVSCWPIPESPLEPEVAFKFSETQPESGTKGPDNPSTIVGVESVSCNVCESEGVSDTPYSIDLGGTYYGGTVNFATGVMEVTHVKVVLTGAEEMSWTVGHNSATTVFSAGALWRSYIPAPKTAESGLVCSHFPFLYSGQSDTVHFYVFSAGGAAFWYPDPDMTEAEWKAYLAAQYANGTPVTLCYETSIPYTVPLTPVLVRSLPALSHYATRQNTIYTPHESVQVGYAKSASKTSQDLANAIVALGGNV